MAHIRRFLCLLLCLILLPMPVSASETDQTQAITRDLIAYYFHFREEASEEIENQLQTLSALDPEEGELWREIMGNWAWINEEMPVQTGVLPDGLPEDDSLCIVVLGFGLNSDGSMKQELLDRLEVALDSAEKYPEAYVLCTGGETSRKKGISEAGQMGNWLLAKGLAHNRLILETAALSTTENAKNSLGILWRDYPQIQSIAIVSSDYHIPWGSAVFSAMASYGAFRQGKPRLELVGNAACTTDTPERDSMYYQAWGISIIADVPFDANYIPTLYMTGVQETNMPTPVPAAMPAAESAPVQTEEKEPVVLVLLGLAAALTVLFIPKKKKTDGSH